MPLINNPLPSSMRSECQKAGGILASFVDPRQAFGPDRIIPSHILANAKGLAIMTVFKAGFLGSGRFGSGVVVARLADGSWSAPSAIGTVGDGSQSQMGFELTDIVFVLNDSMAVKTFAQFGFLSLGGNVSFTAGPVGRNVEGADAMSPESVAGVFVYSNDKGQARSASPEGIVLIERRDANERLYNRKVAGRELLSGNVAVPAHAESLMRVLRLRVFAGSDGTFPGDNKYNDVPVSVDRLEGVVWEGSPGSAFGEDVRTNRTGSMSSPNEYQYRDNATSSATRASSWADEPYDRASNNTNPFSRVDAIGQRSSNFDDQSDHVYSDANGPSLGRPAAPKPVFSGNKGNAGPRQAIAKFTFNADQSGDLAFKKDDIITILKRTESKNDWWTGRVGDKEGIFPSNYVEMV